MVFYKPGAQEVRAAGKGHNIATKPVQGNSKTGPRTFASKDWPPPAEPYGIAETKAATRVFEREAALRGSASPRHSGATGGEPKHAQQPNVQQPKARGSADNRQPAAQPRSHKQSTTAASQSPATTRRRPAAVEDSQYGAASSSHAPQQVTRGNDGGKQRAQQGNGNGSGSGGKVFMAALSALHGGEPNEAERAAQERRREEYVRGLDEQVRTKREQKEREKRAQQDESPRQESAMHRSEYGHGGSVPRDDEGRGRARYYPPGEASASARGSESPGFRSRSPLTPPPAPQRGNHGDGDSRKWHSSEPAGYRRPLEEMSGNTAPAWSPGSGDGVAAVLGGGGRSHSTSPSKLAGAPRPFMAGVAELRGGPSDEQRVHAEVQREKLLRDLEQQVREKRAAKERAAAARLAEEAREEAEIRAYHERRLAAAAAERRAAAAGAQEILVGPTGSVRRPATHGPGESPSQSPPRNRWDPHGSPDAGASSSQPYSDRHGLGRGQFGGRSPEHGRRAPARQINSEPQPSHRQPVSGRDWDQGGGPGWSGREDLERVQGGRDVEKLPRDDSNTEVAALLRQLRGEQERLQQQYSSQAASMEALRADAAAAAVDRDRARQELARVQGILASTERDSLDEFVVNSTLVPLSTAAIPQDLSAVRDISPSAARPLPAGPRHVTAAIQTDLDASAAPSVESSASRLRGSPERSSAAASPRAASKSAAHSLGGFWSGREVPPSRVPKPPPLSPGRNPPGGSGPVDTGATRGRQRARWVRPPAEEPPLRRAARDRLLARRPEAKKPEQHPQAVSPPGSKARAWIY